MQNLELDRDSVWRPRPGLVSRISFSNNIQHLSAHPNDTHLMAIENGVLRFVAMSGWTSSSLASSFATNGWFKSAIGYSGGSLYWVCSEAATTDAIDTIRAVNSAGTISSLAAEANGNWCESYGQYLFTSGPTAINYSAVGDITTWSALDNEPAPMSVGTIAAFLVVQDGMALILGDRGCGQWNGAAEDDFIIRDWRNLTAIPYGMASVRCGGRVVIASPGPRLYEYSHGNGLQMISGPIERELNAISNWDNAGAHYDPVRNEYVLSSVELTKTWHYSFDRSRWASQTAASDGAASKCLVGYAATGSADDPSFARRFTAVGKHIMEYDSTVYTDNSAAMTCAVETAIDDRGLCETEKCLTEVYVGGRGSMTVTLYGRDNLEDSWTTVTGSAVTAPGSSYFAVNNYKERKIRVSWTAAANTYLRDLVVFESTIGNDF